MHTPKHVCRIYTIDWARLVTTLEIHTTALESARGAAAASVLQRTNIAENIISNLTIISLDIICRVYVSRRISLRYAHVCVMCVIVALVSGTSTICIISVAHYATKAGCKVYYTFKFDHGNNVFDKIEV